MIKHRLITTISKRSSSGFEIKYFHLSRDNESYKQHENQKHFLSSVSIQHPSNLQVQVNSSRSRMAPNENLTAVLYGVEDLRLENQKVPEIADDGELSRSFDR